MGKTKEQLEKDANAVIKQVLSVIEEMASLPPEVAAHPYKLEAVRRPVVRSIWALFKGALAYDGRVDDASTS